MAIMGIMGIQLEVVTITWISCKAWKHRKDRPWTAISWTCSTTHCL